MDEIRFVHGNPDAEEIAAVSVVLMALLRAGADTSAHGPADAPLLRVLPGGRRDWYRPSRSARAAATPAPQSWPTLGRAAGW